MATATTKVDQQPQATRETVESIVVAVILAFLFRAFVAEAFVIPTGSMAPTLQGRHLDLECPQCGFEYRTGASMENEGEGMVQRTSCQVCRFPFELDRSASNAWLKTNRDSFNGDRILVSKFAYQLEEPERWDVIVFKYPGNAKVNYIKRLIGLPGESLKIYSGDVYVAEGQRDVALRDRSYSILRRPPEVARSMLQVVDDTKYIGDILREAGWPSRWTQHSEVSDEAKWQVDSSGQQFAVTAGQETSWLRYRHIVPWTQDWNDLLDQRLPSRLEAYQGQLITDYYAYNDFYPALDSGSSLGDCWVGDLAIEGEVRVETPTGEITLSLVEGGIHHRCRIDVETGKASLELEGGEGRFIDAEGAPVDSPTAATKLLGTGAYEFLFANLDNQLLLWLDGELVEFEGPTTFEVEQTPVPKWSPEAPGDLAPAGIGARDTRLHITRLKVLRDVYYQAVQRDYKYEYEMGYTGVDELRRVFSTPRLWESTKLFRNRRSAVFELEEDQFFPMGDNSPQSKDARLWSDWGTEETGYDDPPPYVDRDLLIGKALLIYWPHAWRPFLPNFTRMGLIR